MLSDFFSLLLLPLRRLGSPFFGCFLFALHCCVGPSLLCCLVRCLHLFNWCGLLAGTLQIFLSADHSHSGCRDSRALSPGFLCLFQIQSIFELCVALYYTYICIHSCTYYTQDTLYLKTIKCQQQHTWAFSAVESTITWRKSTVVNRLNGTELLINRPVSPAA